MGDKMMTKSTLVKMRKTLSDITNLHSPRKDKENLISGIADSSTKNYIEQLSKENALMLKLIQEKDKIIESNGVELQKLRVSLQKSHMQNWHLAQSNSQMIAELNMCKEKFKVFEHELACKNAWYGAKLLELQEKAKVQCEAHSVQERDSQPEKAAPEKAAGNEPTQAVLTVRQAHDNKENKVSKTKRGRVTRSQSLGATTSQQVADKEIAENKRRCMRRQSVRLRSLPQADLFEVDVVDTHKAEPLEQTLIETTSERSDGDKVQLMQSPQHYSSQRSSIGRPVRRAAEKIQSYKDPPLNSKMRRP